MVELKHFGYNIINGFLVIVLSLSIVLAAPGVPHQFYGDVIINGYSAPDDVSIDVYDVTGGNTYVSGTFTKDGEYGYQPDIFYVPDPYNSRNGHILEFYVENVAVINYTFNNGASTKLDLSVTIPGYHFCGDGTCDSDESCSSCPADCGVCSSDDASSSGGSSSGGSSGSSSIPPPENNTNETSNETSGSDTIGNDTIDENETIICEEDWKCSEWFECFNSKQKRVCTDLNDCDTEINKPSETQACLETSTGNETSDENNSFFTTTGRFLTSPTGLVSLFGLILVVVVGFLVYQKKLQGTKTK